MAVVEGGDESDRDPDDFYDIDAVADGLAVTLLSVRWTRESLVQATRAFIGSSKPDNCDRLIDDLLSRQPYGYPPPRLWLFEFLLNSAAFDRLVEHNLTDDDADQPQLVSPAFNASPQFQRLSVPQLTTQGDLAHWLGLSLAQFDWFADHLRTAGETVIPDLQHYRYHFVPKRSGPPRLVEEPKPRLKTMQRRILREMIAKVPAHPAAHGFVARRSCLTAAQVHANEAVVLRMDLKNFFVSTPVRRVHGVFRSLGYPHLTARALTGLVSTATPARVFERPDAAGGHDHQTRRDYAGRHLPQGAPTSPALANLAAWRLDVRLTGLADAFAARYTRYADDLTFSGDAGFERRSAAFLRLVTDIVEDEGYRLNAAKTRVMPQSVQQRVTGIVVNRHVNIDRRHFDRLKATLHNCVRHGPVPENRDGVADFKAHLLGKVAWVEQVNPARGAKLRRLFDAISWPAATSPPD
ncbi:MAG: reverse transcriptase family protein [Pseudomonadota bacterium]